MDHEALLPRSVTKEEDEDANSCGNNWIEFDICRNKIKFNLYACYFKGTHITRPFFCSAVLVYVCVIPSLVLGITGCQYPYQYGTCFPWYNGGCDLPQGIREDNPYC